MKRGLSVLGTKTTSNTEERSLCGLRLCETTTVNTFDSIFGFRLSNTPIESHTETNYLPGLSVSDVVETAIKLAPVAAKLLK